VGYIAGLILVGLFFLVLHYFTELTRNQKAVVTTLALAIVLSAVAFNAYSNTQREKMLNVVMKFNQHNTVNCNGVDVNSTNYTLSIGTYTFIGKENTPHYGEMISASRCE
jgi:ABC-type branched-subunit amino acid transport system permease subunit